MQSSKCATSMWRGFAIGFGATAAAGAWAADMQSWSEMQAEVVSADAIMAADVTNGFNPVGKVSDLVLSPDARQVQYVLYEVPYLYAGYGAEDGFVALDNAEFEMSTVTGLQVRFADPESAQGPEELELSRAEADHRLVSNLIGSELRFADDERRRVTDILLERESGAVAHYVVEMDAESLFGVDRRVVPADMVQIDDEGTLTASIDIRGVDEILQEYDQAYL